MFWFLSGRFRSTEFMGQRRLRPSELQFRSIGSGPTGSPSAGRSRCDWSSKEARKKAASPVQLVPGAGWGRSDWTTIDSRLAARAALSSHPGEGSWLLIFFGWTLVANFLTHKVTLFNGEGGFAFNWLEWFCCFLWLNDRLIDRTIDWLIAFSPSFVRCFNWDSIWKLSLYSHRSHYSMPENENVCRRISISTATVRRWRRCCRPIWPAKIPALRPARASSISRIRRRIWCCSSSWRRCFSRGMSRKPRKFTWKRRRTKRLSRLKVVRTFSAIGSGNSACLLRGQPFSSPMLCKVWGPYLNYYLNFPSSFWETVDWIGWLI